MERVSSYQATSPQQHIVVDTAGLLGALIVEERSPGEAPRHYRIVGVTRGSAPRFELEQVDGRVGTDLVTRVRSAIRASVSDPRRPRIARELGMSERTLQRHLVAHGRTFQSVVNDVRRAMAESLLSTTAKPLSEIALLTGFSDQSAFQRAFKSWAGRTPLNFRQAARNAEPARGRP